jgi:hypothetical protein
MVIGLLKNERSLSLKYSIDSFATHMSGTLHLYTQSLHLSSTASFTFPRRLFSRDNSILLPQHFLKIVISHETIFVCPVATADSSYYQL